MEERTNNGFSPGRQLLFRFLRNDKFLISLLLALATFSRIWHLYHTEVTARDSIGFERYASELQHKEWKQAVRDNVHHPLYPITILAISVPVRWCHDGTDLSVMQLSAQLASGLAGIVLVIPMFYLGKELFDARVGFWATALFQCFPASGRVLSDALSEPLFLLLTVAGLLLGVRALRSASLVRFALCGLCTGLAYLTRPEGILLGISVGLVLLGLQLSQAQRVWPRSLIQFACLTASVLAVAAPYVAIIHGFSNKTTATEVLRTAWQGANSLPSDERAGRVVGWAESSRPTFRSTLPRISVGLEDSAHPTAGPLFACMLASWWPDGQESGRSERLAWSLYALGSEIGKGFFYIGWLPALVGLYWFRKRLYAVPGAWVLLILCLLQSLALLRVAMVAGYVSDRHVLIIVLCGMYWAVATVFRLSEKAMAGTEQRRGELAEQRKGERLSPILRLAVPPILFFPVFPVVLFLAVGTLALTRTLPTLHANRAGHHATGLWLAEHAGPADEIIDPFCWAAHYAGRTFPNPSDSPVDPSICRHRYIVHECRPDHREKYRPPSIPEADIRAAGGRIAYHWPSGSPLTEAKILLYDVPLHPED